MPNDQPTISNMYCSSPWTCSRQGVSMRKVSMILLFCVWFFLCVCSHFSSITPTIYFCFHSLFQNSLQKIELLSFHITRLFSLRTIDEVAEIDKYCGGENSCALQTKHKTSETDQNLWQQYQMNLLRSHKTDRSAECSNEKAVIPPTKQHHWIK